MVLKISNRNARALWLGAQGLAAPPTGPLKMPDLAGIVEGLGAVQLDTIQVVSRAHHHILWSRNHNYREPMLDRLLAKERAVFEHFTHDASVIPMAFYPLWRRQFARLARRFEERHWSGVLPSRREREKIRKRIEAEGPLSTRDFTGKADKSIHPWMRPPHKFALDFMWYAGTLATAHRLNFVKYYDLSERVIPAPALADRRSEAEQVDWLCRSALDRLAFGSEADIAGFWDAADIAEVKAWAAKKGRGLVSVEVAAADGSTIRALAPADIEERLENVRAPAARLRILNPFDPVIRNRTRLERLFGFTYRIEIFVPAAKRQYGYYIYPILEGDRFVGRIEVRGERKAGTLTVDNLWPEPKVSFSGARGARLEAELGRLARLAGAETVVWKAKARKAR